MKDDPDNYYEDERVIGEEGWEEVDENDVSRSMSQDDVAIAITPSIDEGGSLFTKIEIITCDIIRGGTHLFKKGTRYIIGKFLNQLSNIFVSEIGRMFQVWFLNKYNDLVNDMAINVFSGLMNEEAVNFNLRYIDTIYNYDDIIPMGLNLQNKSVEINSNGQIEVEPDFGYQGLGEVNIKTNVPEKRLQSKSVAVNQNGFDQIYPDSGYDGLSYVNLNVNIPSVVNNQSKSIIVENNGFQQVVPDQGYSGISQLNLTIDVPQPSIQEDDVRYIVPSLESRQIIVRPGSGFDALEKVTLNISSAPLVTNQNILNISSSGTFNLPSLANESSVIGFADSCTVSVNVSVINVRYISLSSGAEPAGKLDLLNVNFSLANSYSIPPGRTLVIVVKNGENVIGFRCIGNRTGASSNLTGSFTSQYLTSEINYDLGDRVYLKNENEEVVLTIGVNQIGNNGYGYRTDYFTVNPNLIKFMIGNS